MKLSKNSKRFINYFLGPLLFVWLAGSIYRQISQQPHLEIAWQQIRDSFGSTLIWNLILVIFLMTVNWLIEAAKWKISAQHIQHISIKSSILAVLCGVSFAVSTPNRMGEYVGRVMYMKEGNRLRTISVTIVGSISQLIITLFFGLLGLLVLRNGLQAQQLISGLWMDVLLSGVAIVLVFLTFFYFRLSWLVKWLDKLPAFKRFTYLVEALEKFNATLLLKLLSLSLLRYGVFILQYYLVFHLFNVDLHLWEVLWTVSVSFLVLAIIPTITLLELVQRGKVVATIVGLYSANELGMNLATASIWFINLVIPALAGSLLILRMKKIMNIKNEES